MNKAYISDKNNFLIGFLIILTIVFLIALGHYFKLQFISTTILTPALFLIAFIKNPKTIINNSSEYIWLILILIGGFTSIYYIKYYNPYIINLSSLFGAVLAAFIPLSLNQKKDYSTYFHIGYILSILILIIIMYINGNFNFLSFATKVDFRDRFLLNANAYSYYSFFGNFSLFFLHQKYKSRLLTILLLFVPILFIIISFTTQSRSGLILIVLINLTYWLFINTSQNQQKIKKLLKKAAIFIALIALAIQFINIYQTSRIKTRLNAVEGDSRGDLIINSLEVFSDNPIFGVGLGQLPFYNKIGQFSHNSYVEIIAEQGIIGGVMLLLLFGIPFKKCIILLKKQPKNPYVRLLLLFFATFYIFNNAYPFYKFPFSMMYFFLVISLQNNYFKKVVKY